jgi:hypothetical protein
MKKLFVILQSNPMLEGVCPAKIVKKMIGGGSGESGGLDFRHSATSAMLLI